MCDIIDPPIIERIPNNSPAMGMPVCCIGIVFVSAFNIVVEFLGVTGLVLFFVAVTWIVVEPMLLWMLGS